MGFFDSVSKKKESPPSFMSGLPPPPPPEKKIKLDVPLLAPMPPPLPPKLQHKIEDKAVLSMPFSPPPMSFSPAPLPVKKETKEVFSQEPFTLPNMSQRNISMPIPSSPDRYISNAPESLPIIPKTKSIDKEQDLGSFSDMYEEVPFFNQEPELEELSSLKISDSEEEQNIIPEIAARGPLFIRTDHYSNLLTVVDSINDYIELSSDTIYSIDNLKKNAAVEHGKYKSLMEDIQRKLIYIDKILFEKGVI